MKRACIAIVDAARARLYTYQEDSIPGREMREIRDLSNVGRRMKAGDMFSETRPASGGLGRPGHGAVPNSGKDDHRDDHIEMMDAKFAKEIVEELDRIIRAEAYGHLVLVAAPKMLGELRKANGSLNRNGMVVEEVPRDFANLNVAQLHDHLASLDLSPSRQRRTIAR